MKRCRNKFWRVWGEGVEAKPTLLSAIRLALDRSLTSGQEVLLTTQKKWKRWRAGKPTTGIYLAQKGRLYKLPATKCHAPKPFAPEN